MTDPGTEYARVKAYEEMAELVCGQFGLEPSMLLAVGYRESWLGWAPGYFPKGPCGWGDGGNAWGPFQIDKRYHASFVYSPAAQDLEKQMFYACTLLRDNRTCFERAVPGADKRTLDKLMLASYNCGYYRALNTYKSGKDPDQATTGKDYSDWVLKFKERIDNHQLQGDPNGSSVPVS